MDLKEARGAHLAVREKPRVNDTPCPGYHQTNQCCWLDEEDLCDNNDQSMVTGSRPCPSITNKHKSDLFLKCLQARMMRFFLLSIVWLASFVSLARAGGGGGEGAWFRSQTESKKALLKTKVAGMERDAWILASQARAKAEERAVLEMTKAEKRAACYKQKAEKKAGEYRRKAQQYAVQAERAVNAKTKAQAKKLQADAQAQAKKLQADALVKAQQITKQGNKAAMKALKAVEHEYKGLSGKVKDMFQSGDELEGMLGKFKDILN